MSTTSTILFMVDDLLGRAMLDLDYAADDLSGAGNSYEPVCRRLRELASEIEEIMGELRR